MTPSKFSITKYTASEDRYGNALDLALLPVAVFIGTLTALLH